MSMNADGRFTPARNCTSKSVPPAITLSVVLDRTTSIRASFRDIQITLLITVILVVFVVFVFLRSLSATLIPSIAVPLSLIGTFAGMYVCGYSLDNLSLMALTIVTGFVVDDAIVVLENITRYREAGLSRMAAAFRGAREIGFTVLSMTVSLVAVFIPVLMGGIVGRLFRNSGHADIAVAICPDLAESTPMIPRFLRATGEGSHGGAYARRKI